MDETIIMDGVPMSMDSDPYFDDFNNFNRHVFDDDVDDVLRSHGRGRTDLRAHLDDLARRHPEFAEHLRSPPGWVSDFHTSGGGGGGGGSSSGHYAASYGGSGPEGDFVNKGERKTSNTNNPSQQQPHQQTPQNHPHPTTEQQEQKPPAENIQQSKVTSNYSSVPPKVRDSLLQHGLRNTDPEIGLKGQAAVKEDRNQRSMSAPPDGRTQLNSDKPQRFVSKIEINPVNPATGETAGSSNSDNSSGKPPMAPPKQQPQQQPHQGTPPQHKQSTVRHIPIFVEGRDEPVLPKNIDQDFTAPPPRPTHQFTAQPPQPQFHPNQQQQFHPQQPQNQQQPQRKPSQQQNHPPTNSQQPQPETKENVQQQNNQQPSQPQAEKKQKFNNDPMYQIQLVQSEVDELRKTIDQFKGSSRTDKEYIYLDEMLTRNLIKLDIIETDGKENVRAARKETIRNIQQCINLLESKVPQTPISQTPSSTTVNEDSGSKMDVDEGNAKNDTVTKGDNQGNLNVDQAVADKNKMETDQQTSELNVKSANNNQMIVEENQQKPSIDIQQSIDATNQPTAVNVSDPKDNNTNTNEIKC